MPCSQVMDLLWKKSALPQAQIITAGEAVDMVAAGVVAGS